MRTSPQTLDVETLLAAYRAGMFPMADADTGSISWFNPDPRAIIPLGPAGTDGGFHVSRSLARSVRARKFIIRSDTAFEQVIRTCGERRADRPDTWIDERIVRAYTQLHEAGHAHCVEAWIGSPSIAPAERQHDQDAEDRLTLVGGVYGVSIGAAFFAESMFCRPERGGTGASKVALVHLVSHLRRRGYVLLDVQFWNPHIDQFGTVEVRRREYLGALKAAVSKSTEWAPFEPESVEV